MTGRFCSGCEHWNQDPTKEPCSGCYYKEGRPNYKKSREENNDKP